MKWVERLFIPRTSHIKKPILLILDGRGSHLNIDMIDLLVQNDIHLYCLPPNTKDILQPLDVVVFRSLKTSFSHKDLVKLATLATKTPICKKNFTSLFKEAYEQALSVSTIKKGFRKCGICPFDPQAIDKKRLMPSNEVADHIGL